MAAVLKRDDMHRIVIVGGGAGGLALATQLGRRLGRRKLADITLVDSARTHVWKPLLHQLAAGSFDTHAVEIEYLAHARWSHFSFRLGSLTGVDDATAPEFVYADRGSLVSLAEYSSVGSLMGSLTRGSLFVEGQLAKMMYWGLHKQHQLALSGVLKTVLITLSEMLDRTHRPRIKLY